ncbi:TIGR04063 family PEP-CTERM/XrtA system glycosyltransferase [Ferrovum myxofaciens]|jgi:PEP-CTERM/exosortase A-associated glycosyltransferase|uniref:TIGR04063 family PEP-CTERM/XrtA system glycosyltransferase n=1 Tax=Ferrovum myxofaciens TaxID=416213 RepID=UPI003EBFF718
MRILHILDHSLPLHSGYTFRTLSILKEQRALGWETCHLTSEKQTGCTVPEETVEGWHFYRTPPRLGLQSTLPLLNQVAVMKGLERRLHEVIEKTQPDILHAHSPVLNAFPALKVGRQYRIPVVYEVRAFWEDAAVDHGTTKEGSLRYRLTRALETLAFRQANAITTICEGLRRDILSRGIAEDKVTVIPNAVDIAHFPLGGPPDLDLQKHLGLADAQVLGFIGSFYAYEGLSLLLEAMPQILTTLPQARILLVGGGPQEETLKALAQRLNIADKVVFAGRVPHQDVHRYYDLIDVLVYPRMSMRLTELVTPLKPLEAMAQGKSFVASDVGGHKELIQHEKTGLLFEAGNPRDLTHAVHRLFTDPTLRHNLVLAGRAFVETERTWKNSVHRYLPLYQRLLAHPHP